MVANRVRYWRKKLDVKQLELSSMSGVSTAVIVATERYGYVPGSDVRGRLSRGLGVSEEKLWPNLTTNADVKN